VPLQSLLIIILSPGKVPPTQRWLHIGHVCQRWTDQSGWAFCYTALQEHQKSSPAQRCSS